MKLKQSLWWKAALVAGILILFNLLSYKIFFRLDLSDDNRYTLSDATINVLQSLPQTVTIKAYFSDGLPPEIASVKREIRDLLVEYASLSDGNIVYEFINPNKDEETEQKAMEAGVQPVIINVPGKDKVEQMKAFLGVVIEMGDEQEVIPFLQPDGPTEYELSSKLKKLAVTDKSVIGFLQSHGEASVRSMQQALEALEVLYSVEPVYQNDTVNSLLKYTTLAIVAPTDSFPPLHLKQLDEFLANGGNLLVAINRVKGNLQENPPSGTELTTGLETWLAKKGLLVQNDFIVDSRCQQIGVQQRQGMISYTTAIDFPYIPILTNFAEHPATAGLEAVVLPFASSITYTGDSSLLFTPLVFSSEQSGTQAAPVYFDVNKKWNASDFANSNQVIAGVLEGKIVGNQQGSVLVISDGDFAVNGEGQQAQQVQPDNVNLLVNSIDWLADDSGFSALRTKGVSSRPFEQIEDSSKALIKWLNFIVPILLIVLYGLLRMQKRRALRTKRMQQGVI